jgi:predicted transcriptional regulator
MAVSYKKLWKLLIDKDMKKKDLEAQAKISHYTVSKMYRSENVTVDILERICRALDCSIEDIMEFVPDSDSTDESP